MMACMQAVATSLMSQRGQTAFFVFAWGGKKPTQKQKSGLATRDYGNSKSSCINSKELFSDQNV